MIISFIIAFIVCFLVSYLTCWIVRLLGGRIGLVDKPGLRKIHEKPMPTGGGLGIWLGITFPLLAATFLANILKLQLSSNLEATHFLNIPYLTIPDFIRTHVSGIVFQSVRLWQLLGLGTILVILGTLDDRFNLNWKLRFGIQALVAIFAVKLGWKATFFVDIPWLTSLISIIWIIGLTNSFNLLDNMDALSAGVAAISALFLSIVMLGFATNPLSGEPQLFLGGFLLILVAALLGFLLHNRPPAKMFMGDGGAYFIGFLLATTTLSATFVGDNAPKQAILVPICILAVPIYDTFSVIVIRLRNHKSPFEGDTNHYSHRLVRRGLSKPKAVLTIYLTTVICSINALFLYQVGLFSALLMILQIVMIFVLIAIFESHH
ncbi:MAG: MraY family glycosyltransferase [Planctomycetia bacterium]|nr:MraY family glycosyltransferase [Planctomycetia bacterium]